MTKYLKWNGEKVPFEPGEMLAYTLMRARVSARRTASGDDEGLGLGTSSTGQPYGLFCGIGACQGCLVQDRTGRLFESCLIPSDEALEVWPVGEGPSNDGGTP